MNMITVKYVTDFQWFYGFSDFFEPTRALFSMNLWL